MKKKTLIIFLVFLSVSGLYFFKYKNSEKCEEYKYPGPAATNMINTIILLEEAEKEIDDYLQSLEKIKKNYMLGEEIYDRDYIINNKDAFLDKLLRAKTLTYAATKVDQKEWEELSEYAERYNFLAQAIYEVESKNVSKLKEFGDDIDPTYFSKQKYDKYEKTYAEDKQVLDKTMKELKTFKNQNHINQYVSLDENGKVRTSPF